MYIYIYIYIFIYIYACRTCAGSGHKACCNVGMMRCGRTEAAGARRHATRAAARLFCTVTSPLSTLMECTSRCTKSMMIALAPAGSR